MRNDKPTVKMTERKTFSGQLTAFFAGWEVKKEILRPIIVNLLTAAALFLAAVGLKDRVVSLFSSPQKVTDWPLFCSIEPHPSNGGPVIADLFVVNLSSKPYTASDLAALAKLQSSEDRKEIDSSIAISLRSYLSGESITSVQGDDEFNKEKGSAGIQRIDNTHWKVAVGNIKSGVTLKFTITTTVDRAISSRASIESLPVSLSYARSP